jgi:phage I-like protein
MLETTEKPAFDALAMRGDAAAGAFAGVERGSDGLPKAWRLLAFGPLSLTKDGKTSKGSFTEADADLICSAHKSKGVKLPIDSNHVMHALAGSLGQDERDIAAATGTSELAMGFGDLEKRPDGLWLSGVSWTPIGAGLMREKAFRHFSPVFRGLSDGNLRVTSVSVLNYPAIDGQEAIACAGEGGNAPQVDNGLAAGILKALGLPPETAPEDILKAVEGLAMRLNELSTQQQEMACAAESARRKDLISDAMADGRLSNALLPWAQSQTSAALSAFLSAAPRVVPVGRSAPASAPASAAAKPPHDPVLSMFGVSAEDFAKFSTRQ